MYKKKKHEGRHFVYKGEPLSSHFELDKAEIFGNGLGRMSNLITILS